MHLKRIAKISFRSATKNKLASLEQYFSLTLHYKKFLNAILLMCEAAGLNWFEKLFAKSFFGGVPEGTYEESIKMFMKALAIDNNLIAAYYNLSKTYDKIGDRKDELSCLNKVMRLPVRNFSDKYSKIKTDKKLEELKD